MLYGVSVVLFGVGLRGRGIIIYLFFSLNNIIEETLMIVTADHSHVFTMGGYPDRGNPILGYVSNKRKADDGMKFTTLSYANGPGGKVNQSR